MQRFVAMHVTGFACVNVRGLLNSISVCLCVSGHTDKRTDRLDSMIADEWLIQSAIVYPLLQYDDNFLEEQN